MKARSSRYVALLRGINVGGHNKLPMAELTAIFRDAGFRDVATYIQSGNVVFGAAPALAGRIAEVIAGAIERRLGLCITVVVRTAAELARVWASNPFAELTTDHKLLHVMFLGATPAADRAALLDPERSPGDRFALRGRELFVFYPNGAATTRLTNDYVERTLRTSSTARNWRTVGKLVEMCAAPG